MTLAALIQKGGLLRVATATSATSATHVPDRLDSVATVATVTVADSPRVDIAAAAHWQVCYPGVEPIEVIFAPKATRAEVAAVYPGAEIDVLPDAVQRDATPEEAAELRKLVAMVLTDADDAERAEALGVALADPEDALRSFRALVNQR